jgi:uncharacterized Fe-S radical SAM superfamily protein PflX
LLRDRFDSFTGDLGERESLQFLDRLLDLLLGDLDFGLDEAAV